MEDRRVLKGLDKVWIIILRIFDKNGKYLV